MKRLALLGPLSLLRLLFAAWLACSASAQAAQLAVYSFDEAAWAAGLAGQVKDSSPAARGGTALGGVQTSATGHTCRSASIPLNTAAATVDAVKTGINIADPSLTLQSTGSVTFWYRSTLAWSGATARDAQLLDATAVAGEWFFLSKTTAGALVFEVKDSTGTLRSVSTPAQAFAANTWVHVAVSWNFNSLPASNQDSLQIFVNAGVPVVSAFTSSGSVSASAGNLYVGDNAIGSADTLGSVSSANGLIDEVEVHDIALTQAQVTTAKNSTHVCPVYSIDHLEVQHASGNGLTCTPSTLTVRACQDAACATPYIGGVAGTLVATGTPTTNWDGSTGNGSAGRFVIPAGSSSVTKGLQVTKPGSVLLSSSGLAPATVKPTSCNFGTPACTFTAADTGFLFGGVATHTADTAQAITVSAVRSSDSSPVCVPAFMSTSKTVNLKCSYANPTSGTRPARVGGLALNAANNTATACDATGANLSLAFDATGKASTSLQYADVGSVNLTARYAPVTGTEIGLVMTGTASFIARPAGFTLSNVHCSATTAGNCALGLAAPGNNPAAASATDAAFIPAGKNFSATVTAVNASGTATPNFGRESVREGVKLTAALVLPAGGAAPALVNGSIPGTSFNAGAATVTTLSWPEVGIIRITPSIADGDYIGTGDVTGPVSANVGRFVPSKFALSANPVTLRADLACAPASGFNYLGENMRFDFTLTAQSSAGTTTQNYTGAFAKLDPANTSAWQLAGISGSTMFSLANARLSLGTAAGSWSNGVASGVTLTAAALRAAAPDGPFLNSRFGVAPVDSDGVAMASFNLDTDSPANGNDRALVGSVLLLHFGRLRVDNAIGAADRALTLPVTAQYWNGTAFATETLDSCTTLATSALSFGNLRQTLTAADTAAGAAITINGGIGSLKLNAPGGGRSGTYDIALSLGSAAVDASCLQPWTQAGGDAATAGANLAYLRGAWCSSTYDKDPAARATFGLQRTQDNSVYRRENY